ncbi:beta-galactosidase [Microterricola viridarii]|uniref:Beta-galactosidase n=1 Tax=Microterricola viridarii TaxID=412690 RepID=A0A1H1MI65_9MICO|nr:beta-galactosidase [Microterricola viridarii]SDR86416.1 beta-galactosidase [Microterricola viridarii]
MHYGGDYNPEQWPEQTWHEDVARMREAGVTMVSLGIFAWARIQPAEGVFDWEWLDTVIELLHQGGIAVDLATATASPPPWATSAYPEMLPRDADGSVFWPGSRQAFAPSSPVYRRLAAELVTALVERYKDNPAVVMWHVNNEYGCHLHYDYSDNARDAFRVWLEAKYGTVEALNAAWGTAFWSQLYTDFDQIVPPRKAPYSLNPAGLLDFKRFTSDTLLELFRMEKAIIRSAGATQPVTTNFMGAFPPADYWRWAQEIDVISDDCYPDPNDPESFRASAFARDLMRSFNPDVPWILMEQATNALNWRQTNAPKAPGQMAAVSMQAVARGADGVMFFQWRQSRSGSEKFHSAMLPQAGTRTRTWREVTALGAELAALPELPRGSRDARVAIVFDWQNWWAIGNPDHPVVLDYPSLVQDWYAAIHRLHVQVDIVQPGSDLEGYRVVIAPQLYLLTADDAANLLAFAASGGHLLVTAFSDVVDENDAFREGGYLTQLGGALGIWLEDFGALVPPTRATGTGDSAGATAASTDGAAPAVPGQMFAPIASQLGPITGTLLAEEIHLAGATALGRFAGGRRDGDPAFTVNSHGRGAAYYLATVPDAAGAAAIAACLFTEAGVEPVLAGLPETVEAVRRGAVLTLINHDSRPATVVVPAGAVVGGSDAALSARTAAGGIRPAGELTLDPFGFVLLNTEI